MKICKTSQICFPSLCYVALPPHVLGAVASWLVCSCRIWGRLEIRVLPVTSCYRDWDKLQPDRPLTRMQTTFYLHVSRVFTKWSCYATRSSMFTLRASRTFKHTLYSLHFGNICTFHNTLVQCTLKWSCVVLNIMTVVCYLYKQNRSPFFTCYPVSTQFCLNQLSRNSFYNQ